MGDNVELQPADTHSKEKGLAPTLNKRRMSAFVCLKIKKKNSKGCVSVGPSRNKMAFLSEIL